MMYTLNYANETILSKAITFDGPPYVDRVEGNDELNRVDIYVKHYNPIRVTCPVCGEFYSMYDHSTEREFQYLDTCEMQTFVHVRLPRVKCPTRGIKQIVSELGEPNSHMTFAYERRIFVLVTECSISAISRLERLSRESDIWLCGTCRCTRFQTQGKAYSGSHIG